MEVKKLSLGETRSLEKELEAFAGPAKKRGCVICRNGDETIVRVARDKGYPALTVAEFLISTRSYKESLMTAHVVYRHWYRCEKVT